jgi:hypothetical protein
MMWKENMFRLLSSGKDFCLKNSKSPRLEELLPNIAPTGAALRALRQYLQPYIVGLKYNVYLGKVDWDIVPKDRLSVRYNASRYTGVN